MKPIKGAPQSIRRLGTEGIRIRIITHRLFIRWFHETAVSQTVRWLEKYSIPYWDLCFMRDKESVDAHVFVDDTPEQIEHLRRVGRTVIVFDNSTNLNVLDNPGGRAHSWQEAEAMVREYYYRFLDEHDCAHPTQPGWPPPWTKSTAG
jgi:5'(3')-deoxyribonucleotidase